MTAQKNHGPLKWMAQFKSVAIDYEYYLTLSDKPISVCLSERQMYVLSVQNTYTSWLTRWYNTDDINKTIVGLIAAEIEDILMCGCGITVPSITDIINSNNYTSSTSNSYIENNAIYQADGGQLTTIAPNMTYAAGIPADIDKILCFGYDMMLQTIIDQGKGIAQLGGEQSQDLVRQIGIAMAGLAAAGSLALSAGGFAATIVAVIGGPWALLGLAIGGIATGIASLFITADVSLFEDQEAIDLVLCTMRTNSLGNEPTFATFSGLLTPNSFAVGGNAEKLAALVQPFLSSIDFYLQFMVSMSGLYATPLLIALPECDTCAERQSFVYDFLIDEQGWTDGAFGSVYTATTGWGPNSFATWSLFIASVPFTVYEVEVLFDATQIGTFYATQETDYDVPSNGYAGLGNPRVIVMDTNIPSGTRLGLTGSSGQAVGHMTRVTIYGAPI